MLSPITFINPPLRLNFLQNLWKTLYHVTLPPGYIIKEEKHLSRGSALQAESCCDFSGVRSQKIDCVPWVFVDQSSSHAAERVLCSVFNVIMKPL